MGYDASQAKNSTGQAIQLQALSFAGSTRKPENPIKLELPGRDSRILTGLVRPWNPKLPDRGLVFPVAQKVGRAPAKSVNSQITVAGDQNWGSPPPFFGAGPETRAAVPSVAP